MRPPLVEGLWARHASRSALVACLLLAVGAPLDLLLARSLPGAMPWWPAAAASSFGLALGAFLWMRRGTAPASLSSTVFVLNNTALALFLWETSAYWTAPGVAWTPFQANKLGMLIVAVLGPELWAGLFALSSLLLAAALRAVLLSEAQLSGLPGNEPLLLSAIAAFGLGLLLYRLRALEIERALARAHAEVEAARQVATALGALQEMANNPLQVIELSLETLKARHPNASDVTERIGRALDRLRGLRAEVTSREDVTGSRT